MDLTRDELRDALARARPDAGSVVYLQRRGDTYRWGAEPPHDGGTPPDTWMLYTGSWPVDDAERWPAFFDDLLAEMESMAGGPDRCRWPLDDPWPHRH